MGQSLWVGAGEKFAHLRDAVAASRDGDTIYVKAGTYYNDFATVTHDVRIVGVGGKAHFKATVNASNGKAILVTRADVEIENLEFSGAKVRDRNGAGIRHEKGDLTVRDSFFHDNQNGILVAPIPGADILIDGSTFLRNGTAGGRTHGIYVNEVESLTVTDSVFLETRIGHHVKSRALQTTVEGSRFSDRSDGTASYAIDLPNGGDGIIQDNVFEKGARSGNSIFISFGAEGPRKDNSLIVEDNSFVSHRPHGATVVRNATDDWVEMGANRYEGVKLVARGLHRSPAEASPNHDPVGFDDTASTVQGRPVVIPVLANDSDPDGDKLTVSGIGKPHHGEVTVGPDGSLLYRPDPKFTGDDRFSYTVKDAHGADDSASVTVSVTPAPPISGPRETGIAVSVQVSGDHYLGAPLMQLLVDGKPLGGPVAVTAHHDDGEWQDFVFRLDAGAAPGTLGVAFVNDAWGGTRETDRNLWVRQVVIEGETLTPEAATYHRFNGPEMQGQENMAWRGSLDFDIGTLLQAMRSAADTGSAAGEIHSSFISMESPDPGLHGFGLDVLDG